MNRKLLFFGEYGVINGGENSFLAVAPRLANLGWEFVAAVPQATPLDAELLRLGIPTIDFNLFNSNRVRLTQHEIRDLGGDMIRAIRPAVVHCNSLSTSRLMGPVSKQLNVRSLGYLRDILKLSKTAISDINCLDQIVAVSQATRDWHIAQGIDPLKINVIYNGVDSNRFRPGINSSELNEQLKLNESDLVLLYVGQIGMRKGVDTLLKAFEIVRKQLGGVHLLIVGQRNSLKQEAIDFENRARTFAASISRDSGRVIWLGRREDVEVIMNRADLLVHAARQEPLGRVLLEAAACDLPIVATDVGGTREIMSAIGAIDLMVPPDSPTQLAVQIVKLLGEREKLAAISVESRTAKATFFGVDRCAVQLDNLYCQLVRDGEA